MSQYDFTKTPVALDRLERDIRASSITVALDHSVWSDPSLSVYFKADLSTDEQTTLAGIVSAHDGTKLPETPKPVDSDGADLARIKQTSIGWTFQDHSFEFKTSTTGSVVSLKSDGTAFGYATMKFYELVDGNETLITGGNATDQGYLTANAIKTIVDWEPTIDYDVIAGEMRFYTEVTTDTRMWVVIAPDVPANLGGSKELLAGGRNLRFVEPRRPIVIDGRTSKHLTYNATYHSNKIRIIIRHTAGFALAIEACVQFYKA